MSSITLSRQKRSFADHWTWISRDVELGLENLHDYQWLGTHFLLENQFCMLLVDMGLGKTVMVLTALFRLAAQSPGMNLPGPVLIIGPNRVVNQTWPEELRKWRQACGFTYSLVTGSAEDRIAALSVKRDIYLVNRENAQWLEERYKRKWPFTHVIIDESSSFKDFTSSRFKGLSRVRPLIKSLWELTASPATEGYEGLFAQTFLVDRGERFGKAITKFREEYFIENKYNHTRKLKDGADEEILNAIADISLTLKADEYLPRDKYTVQDWHFQPSQKVMDLYERMESEQIITIDEHNIDITSDHAAATWLCLLQIASGFAYKRTLVLDEENDRVIKHRDVYELHREKLDTLLEKLEELQGTENVVIAYWFNESRDRLLKALGKKAVLMDKDGKCVKRWNAGKIRYLLVHPASAGHGLNLQKGGRRIIFYDIPASLELYEQVIGRVDRQGQDKPVFVHHLIASGTMDQVVVNKLAVKANVQEDLFRRLKLLHARYKRRKLKKIREELALADL